MISSQAGGLWCFGVWILMHGHVVHIPVAIFESMVFLDYRLVRYVMVPWRVAFLWVCTVLF